MLRRGKAWAVWGVAGVLAIVAIGCGSSSDSTSTTATDGPGTNPKVGATLRSEDNATSTNGASSGSQEAGSGSPPGLRTPGSGSEGSGGTKGSGSGGQAGVSGGQSGSIGKGAGSGGPKKNVNGAPLGTDTDQTGDNSIETYGEDAAGSEKAAIVGAMRSFILAIAARDYAAVCDGLATKLRTGLVQGGKQCPEVLEPLLTVRPATARQAADGEVTHVRIGGGNAFVLFHPPGSVRLNYVAMTLEDGAWKSLGLTVGTPLEPLAWGE